MQLFRKLAVWSLAGTAIVPLAKAQATPAATLPPTINAGVMLVSHHLNTRGCQFNNQNYGLMLTERVPDTKRWSAGIVGYYGSYRRAITGAGVTYTPVSLDTGIGRLNAGVNLAVVHGYTRSEVPTSPLVANFAFGFTPKKSPVGIGVAYLPPLGQNVGVVNLAMTKSFPTPVDPLREVGKGLSHLLHLRK